MPTMWGLQEEDSAEASPSQSLSIPKEFNKSNTINWQQRFKMTVM
jgi:hypothetical protein